MNRTVIESLFGVLRTYYAWRITTWPPVEGTPLEPAGTVVEGPSDAPEELLALVRKGKGTAFRMKDGDGYVYCQGRLVIADDVPDNLGYDPEFGPLDDYGTPGLGCTSIEFFQRGTDGKFHWVEL